MNEHNQTPPVLKIEDVVKEFSSGGSTIRVLDNIDFEVNTREYVSVVGPSGVGKTTFLHVLGLLDTPTHGLVEVNGKNVTNLPESEKSGIRNHSFGFVYQFYHLIPELTALENVLLPGMISTSVFQWFSEQNDYRERAENLLVDVGLEGRFEHRPSQLSGGERQRVAIARALIMQPELLICDEPTGNLDTKTGRKIMNLLENMKEKVGTALIIATHDERLADRADRKLEIKNGNLLEAERETGEPGQPDTAGLENL